MLIDVTRGSLSNPAAICCKQAIAGEHGDDEQQTRRRSSRGGRAKQLMDCGEFDQAGGLAPGSKIALIDVELEGMTAAFARVFREPGASGDTGADLFYVIDCPSSNHGVTRAASPGAAVPLGVVNS